MFPLCRSLAVLLLLLFLLGTSGCRKRPAFESAYTTPEPLPAALDRDGLLELLESRSAEIETLRSRSSVRLRRDGRRGTDSFTATVLYRAPDSIRLRGSREPIGTLFEVIVTGRRAVLYFNREGTAFVGTTDELREKSGLAGNLNPEDLVQLALVQQNLRERLEADQPVVIEPQRDHYLVAMRDGRRMQYFWRVRRADGLIDRWLVRDAGGTPVIEVRYRAWQLHEVRGRMDPLPTRAEVFVPSSGVRLEMNVDEHTIDPSIPERAFRDPDVDRVYSLRQLEFEER